MNTFSQYLEESLKDLKAKQAKIDKLIAKHKLKAYTELQPSEDFVKVKFKSKQRNREGITFGPHAIVIKQQNGAIGIYAEAPYSDKDIEAAIEGAK